MNLLLMNILETENNHSNQDRRKGANTHSDLYIKNR